MPTLNRVDSANLQKGIVMHKLHSVHRLGCAFCAFLIFAVGAPLAHASLIHGTLNFTVTYGSPAPTGSYVLNTTTNTWNTFTVDWDGAVYDFAFALSFPDADAALIRTILAGGGPWCALAPLNDTLSCGPVPVPGSFSLYGFQSIPVSPTFTDLFAGATGTYTVTETTVATPEPGSLAMMLLGLGVLLAGVGLKRRNAVRSTDSM